jgi:hypothetical protein
MRLLLSFLLCVAFTVLSVNNANAGFLVKKHTFTADSSATTQTSGITKASARSIRREQRAASLSTLKHLVSARHDGSGSGHAHRDNSGWEGIVALVCGILAFAVGWTFIPAIIFGILGLNKRHHGLAVAGLVLGIIVGVILLLVLLVAVTFWGIGF